MNTENNSSSYPDADQHPLVSVLVPSYNHEKYIIECLDSINNLDYPRLELLISDDCSQDDTFRLAEQWAQQRQDRFERILTTRQETNLGMVGNFQYLFDNALGEYLATIASDDMFLKTAISGRVELLEKNRDIDAVLANVQPVSEDGTVSKDQFIPEGIARQLLSRKLILGSLILNACVPGPALMIRRGATLEDGSLGRLPTDLLGEDIYIYVRLAARRKIAFVNSVVAQWRAVPGSASRRPNQSNTRTFLESDKKNRLLLRGLDRLAIDARIARCRIQLNTEPSLLHFVEAAFFRLVMVLLRFVLALRTHLPDSI